MMTKPELIFYLKLLEITRIREKNILGPGSLLCYDGKNNYLQLLYRQRMEISL